MRPSDRSKLLGRALALLSGMLCVVGLSRALCLVDRGGR